MMMNEPSARTGAPAVSRTESDAASARFPRHALSQLPRGRGSFYAFSRVVVPFMPSNPFQAAAFSLRLYPSIALCLPLTRARVCIIGNSLHTAISYISVYAFIFFFFFFVLRFSSFSAVSFVSFFLSSLLWAVLYHALSRLVYSISSTALRFQNSLTSDCATSRVTLIKILGNKNPPIRSTRVIIHYSH